MKRNKKLMLTAIAAMGVVAMGVGGAGTFAWYSVESAQAAKLTDVKSLSTQASTYSAGSYDLLVYYDADLATLDLTDTDGNCWVSVGGYLQQASGTTTSANMAVANFKYKVTTHGSTAALADDALALALRQIGDRTLDVKVQATAYVRVTTTEGNKFSAALGQTITIGTLAISDGAATLTVSNPVYYSVSGNSTNSVPTANTAEGEVVPADQSITVSLADQAQQG